MRVLLDTNVVISALLFPSSTPATAVQLVLQEHQLVLTEWVLVELREVVARKRPDLLPPLERFLVSVDYEVAEPGASAVPISDPDDQPILDAAIATAVDVLVTGDKHFLALNVDSPQIMTARAFVDAYEGSGKLRVTAATCRNAVVAARRGSGGPGDDLADVDRRQCCRRRPGEHSRLLRPAAGGRIGEVEAAGSSPRTRT